MDALGFEYPDYERLDEEAGGLKRKRVVSEFAISGGYQPGSVLFGGTTCYRQLKEIDVLHKVIIGHGDFCALVASRGTAAAFVKAGFITQIWYGHFLYFHVFISDFSLLCFLLFFPLLLWLNAESLSSSLLVPY
ncbi:hypothetical protein ACJX0J_020577, partial [Zea mays]